MFLIWFLGIFLAPVLRSIHPAVSEFLYYLYVPVCHQIPERSFYLAGFPLAVCVRCLSFYLAGFSIISFYLFRYRISGWNSYVYAVLIAPSIIDFWAEKTGLYANLDLMRFFTGALLGLAFFHLIIIGLSVRLKWDQKVV